jgi:hypothetical protein
MVPERFGYGLNCGDPHAMYLARVPESHLLLDLPPRPMDCGPLANSDHHLGVASVASAFAIDTFLRSQPAGSSVSSTMRHRRALRSHFCDRVQECHQEFP